MDLGLRDKVIWVTGGASGIGEGIVRQLAEEGAIPVIIDRDEARAMAVRDSVGGAGAVSCDLTDDAALEETVSGLLNFYGRVDGLVNNAGINDGAGLGSSVSEFRASLERNLVPSFALVRLAAEGLRETSGAIVNVASKVALTGQGGTSGYAAAKGGLLALTREWALELAEAGVRVNAIIPAEVWTPMYERWLATQADPGARRAEIERRIPLGHRMTTVSEIAAMTVFLLSPRSGHTTAQFIHVDGGYVHLDRATL
jgi:L-fucose dehydrogenase